MTHADLQKALEEVLACPRCQGLLLLDHKVNRVHCSDCHALYPVCGGIPVFLQDGSVHQEKERRFRDVFASRHEGSDAKTLWEIVTSHHCFPIMRRRAESFGEQFRPGQWILDIGIGYGWHWGGQDVAAKVLGVDISLGNLKLARTYLGDGDGAVILVCADAAALPIRKRVISGVWSVQAFQHFPEPVLKRAQSELERVLMDEFLLEIYNLNPGWVHRILYRLVGKRLHCRGKTGEMDLNCLSAEEWIDFWRDFRGGSVKLSHGYSELFFHPNFRLRPSRYPVELENTFATHVPKLAALFARQVQVRVESRGMG